VTDGHQLRELVIVGSCGFSAPSGGPAAGSRHSASTTVVPTAAGLVEKFREALGAPAVQETETHRGHLPSLVTDRADDSSAWGRIQTNARRV
jgi:hypothetical protein